VFVEAAGDAVAVTVAVTVVLSLVGVAFEAGWGAVVGWVGSGVRRVGWCGVPSALRVVVKSLVWRWWWSVGRAGSVVGVGCAAVCPGVEVVGVGAVPGVVQPGQIQCQRGGRRVAGLGVRIGGFSRSRGLAVVVEQG
jgi:hypothetical protein